jgi:predicted DNA-binding transcriptional regulator YafY
MQPPSLSTIAQYRRIYQIHTRLRAGECLSMKEMKDALEVCERTIGRDLERLRYDFDAPVEYDPRGRCYKYTDPTFDLPTIQLREGELVAIYVFDRLLSQGGTGPFEAEVRRVLQKVVASLAAEVTVRFDDLPETFSHQVGPVRETDAALYQTLAEAARKRRRLRVRYYSAHRDEETERIIDPYHLFKYENEWYVAAWCHLRNEMRDFLVSGNRFRHVEFTGEYFQRRADVDVDAYLHQSFGIEKGGEPLDVAIRFDAQEARYIRERAWPGEQGKEEHPDGGLTLRFRATGKEEILRWAMKYGSHAEILSPPALRAAAREEVRRMGEQYG